MSLEFKEDNLIDLCELVTDGSHHSPPSQADGYYMASVKDMGMYKINYTDCRKISQEDYEKLVKSGCSPKNNDILIAKDGSPLSNIFIYKEEYPMVLLSSIAIIRTNENKILPKYLKYYLQNPSIKKYIQTTYTSGSVIPRIILKDFKKFPINYPNIENQNRIINILETIDKKIEVNENVNKNLEQYVFNLFNEYFMEFDFNEFSNSNNKIPSSWKLGCFNDIIDSLGSGDWGKEEPTGNYTSEVYCIRGADIPDVKQGNKGKMPIRFILPKNFEKRKLNENSIVIEISGGSPTQSTGRTVFITDNFLNRFDKDIICTNFCKVINPKNEYAIFVYLYLNYLYDKDVMFAYENGTTGIKNFDIKSFINNFLIVIPSLMDITKFNELVKDIFDIIMHNGLEIEKLQQLRDTLLPKLMSGEIDVSKINCDL